MRKYMKVAVIGSGAIGSLVTGYLATKNTPVTLVTRKEQVAVLNKKGLIIDGVRGKRSISLPVVDKLRENVDLIIMAVKTQDVIEAASHNVPFIKDCPILTMQNGIRAEQFLSQIVPSENIISSVVMFGATYIGPGKAIHNFEGDLIIGKAFGTNDGHIQAIADLMNNTFTTHISEDIKGMKWLKVFINLNNCLPALAGKSMQETFKNLELCELSIRLLAEGLEIVDKAAIKLRSLPTFPEERLRHLVSIPRDQSRSLFSQIMTGLSKEPLYGSILQSIQRGSPSEIDYINGEIVALGKEIGIPTPLNKTMVEMVHRVEKTGTFFTLDEVLREMKN